MAFKLNPLTGELDVVTGSNLKEIFNPVTGEFNLAAQASSYGYVFNPINGKLNLKAKTGPVIRTLSGAGYVDLESAVGGKLVNLKAFGGTKQEGTPTPTSPVSIICNNGEIKVRSNGEIYFDGEKEKIKSSSDVKSVETLLGIGGMTDEQDVTEGEVIRRIGIKVLTGKEEWSKGSWFSAPILDRSLFNHLVCTHFVNGIPTNDMTCSKNAGSPNLMIHWDYMPTALDFKNRLAAEYAKGTPVIVLYMLENPVTETVAAQEMNIPSGDSRISISEGSIKDLLISVKYLSNN